MSSSKRRSAKFFITTLLAASVAGLLWLLAARWFGPCGAIEADRDPPRQDRSEAEILAAGCRDTARWLSRQLDGGCRVIVRPPFVVAGDLSEAELKRRYRLSIAPAARAMARVYFTAKPNEPITILLFPREASYRKHAEMLFGERDVSRFGYYRPHLRTLIVNCSTGEGPLRHELTHALLAFDFPAAPDWLNEGLASLHEQSRISDDASAMAGEINWRLPILQKAIARHRLRSLESLLLADDFHGREEQLNYAQARYFCLYLQRQGVLRDVYRRAREGSPADPTGSKAVCNVFTDHTWAELDAAFRQFVTELQPPDSNRNLAH